MKDASSNSHVIYRTPSSTNSWTRATGGDGRNEFKRTMLKYNNNNNIIHIIRLIIHAVGRWWGMTIENFLELHYLMLFFLCFPKKLITYTFDVSVMASVMCIIHVTIGWSLQWTFYHTSPYPQHVNWSSQSHFAG